jgi:hypothetical protein
MLRLPICNVLDSRYSMQDANGCLYDTLTPENDYIGVSEAAGRKPLRNVTYYSYTWAKVL